MNGTKSAKEYRKGEQLEITEEKMTEETLEKIEEMRREEKSTVRAVPKGTASNEMCTFLVMNISSLQLIPVNIIAYRSQYHSVFAAAVTGPCLVATMVSTLAAVFFCRIMDRSNKKGDVL